jgi:hypothetical protein
LGGSPDELPALLEICSGPRRLEVVEQAGDDLLLELLEWIKNPAADG